MGLFLNLYGGIGPGVRHILAKVDPRAKVLASNGDCFVCWAWDDCLGVQWGGCLFLGLGFI